MKTWQVLFAALGVTWVGTSVHADGLSWNYFDADYAYTEADDIDGSNADVDGALLEGSLMFTDSWMFQAGYQSASADFDFASASSESYSAGAAYRFAVADNVNVVVGGGYTYVKAEALAVIDDVTLVAEADSPGGYVNGRVRGRIADRFELEAGVTGVYYGDDAFDEDILFGVKGRFYLTPLLALAVGVSGSKEADNPSFSVGLRLQGSGIGR